MYAYKHTCKAHNVQLVGQAAGHQAQARNSNGTLIKNLSWNHPLQTFNYVRLSHVNSDSRRRTKGGSHTFGFSTAQEVQ